MGQCQSTDIVTDGNTARVCRECGCELEQSALVNEIAFAEGSNGRVYTQGVHVSHRATGAVNNRGGEQSTENIKKEGRQRIEALCNNMGIQHLTQQSHRLFCLAVDNKFNRGRRTEYVIASCVYLQSRFSKAHTMLIEFSEAMQVNVYELGATYLKLRNLLSFEGILPEIDPSVYNLRFASRLEFGDSMRAVADDASRLVRRFKADWMTSGRRPAGICGACLVIAARMNNFLRTPEEIAQVVMVSPHTIKKRLLEFARTAAADKTVHEWRSMSLEQLSQSGEMQPPVVKKQMEAARRQAERAARQRASQRAADGEDSDGDEAEGRAEAALRAAAQGLDEAQLDDAPDDVDLAPLEREDYAGQVTDAGTTEEERPELQRERRQMQRDLRAAQAAMSVDELALAADVAEDDDKEEDMAAVDKEEQAGVDAETRPAARTRRPNRFVKPDEPDWDDDDAVMQWLELHYFFDEFRNPIGGREALATRIKMWLRGRPARDIAQELWAVRVAHQQRERNALVKESTFDDIDDDELDRYWVMDEGERETRARMWLSANVKWLQEDKVRQEKRKADEARHGPGGRAKPKRKRPHRGAPQHGPYASTEKAFGEVIKKRFSTRVNYAAMKELGFDMGDDDELQVMDDEKDDEKEDGKEDDEGDGEEYDDDAEQYDNDPNGNYDDADTYT